MNHWGAYLPHLGLELLGGQTTEVYDALSVRYETYGYLPTCRTLLPCDCYQSVLRGDTKRVNNRHKINHSS